MNTKTKSRTIEITVKVTIDRDEWAAEYSTEDPARSSAENMRATHDDAVSYVRGTLSDSFAGTAGLIVSVA